MRIVDLAATGSPVRIAVTGSHGTGKTSLCAALKDELVHRGYNCSVVSEVARNLISQGIPLARACTMESYYAIATVHIDNLVRAKAPVLIFDRFMADLLAYVRANGNAPQRFDAMMVALSRLSAAKFHQVIYLPIEFPLIANGVRDADREYQALVDRHLVSLLQQLPVPFTVVRGRPTDRAKQALDIAGPLLP